jgi:hypothetical protein
MAAELTPDTAPEAAPRSAWQKWVGFWFPAADPTTLGFVRVTTGLLVLYIHLAYSVDLQQFFGKHGWYSAESIARERREFPWQATPFWSWDPQPIIPAKVPEFPHRRQAFVAYMRNLPGEEGRRTDALRFPDRMAQAGDPDAAALAFKWVREMENPGLQELALTKLLVESPALPPAATLYRMLQNGTYPSIDHPPAFLASLPRAERAAVADEVRAFCATLPADPIPRTYVLEHYMEISPEVRKSLLQFLHALPADEAARMKKIDYLEHWNNEPEKAVRTGHTIFSVWFHVSDPTQMAVIHAAVLAVIVLFTLGLFTRVTSVLTWLAVVGYIHRSQQILFGMDTMMNILLFYLMIGNSGAALSLDRLIARYRAARASLRRTGTIDAPTRVFLASPPPSKGAGFGLRLIQVHFCIIYVAAGLSKLKGGAWWNGQATWDVLVNPEFTLLQYEWYETMLRGVVSIKPVYYALVAFGMWSTLFIEIAGPFLIWTRLRWLIVFLASAMHAGIAVLMGLNLFELLMMVMLVAFLPDGVIRDRLRGGPDLSKLAFAFAPAQASSARAAALVVAADADGQVALAPEPGLTTPAVTAPDGQRLTGPDGVTALFRSVRLLSVLKFVLWVPGVKGLLARRLFPAPAVAAAAPPAAPKPPAPAAAS